MNETAATVLAFALAVATLAAAPQIAIRVPMGAISEREYPITLRTMSARVASEPQNRN
jgi:hypothetical protein